MGWEGSVSSPYRHMGKLGRVRERYNDDPTFHACVEMMRNAIREMHLHPSELREAAILAATIEAELSPHPWPMWMGERDDA